MMYVNVNKNICRIFKTDLSSDREIQFLRRIFFKVLIFLSMENFYVILSCKYHTPTYTPNKSISTTINTLRNTHF